VSIRFRFRPVADACGAPVLRDQGPDRPAEHGKADMSLDHLHAMQFRPTPPPQVRAMCSAWPPLQVTVTVRWIPFVTAA
jgi:hypothetical protein